MERFTVKDICEKLWDIEKKYDLFSKKVEGVHFWKLLRFSLFKKITKKKLKWGDSNTSRKNPIIKKIAFIPKIFHTYFHSVHTRKSTKDILVFTSGRKSFSSGKYVNIYMNPLIEELERKQCSYEVVDRACSGKHFTEAGKLRSCDENNTVGYYIARKITRVTIEENIKELLKEVEKDFLSEYDINFELEKKIKLKVKYFIIERKQYKELLKRRNIKKVYMTCSYARESLIDACREAGVECIELQHGTMGKYHTGYSFPNNEAIPYFPDKMYLFGEFWFDSTPLPLKKENIKIVGYPYLENKLKKYDTTSKRKKQIVFISQGTISKPLSNIAYNLARQNNDYNVIFKLHPRESNRLEVDFPLLFKGSKLENFEVADNSTQLYEFLAESEFAIGVYSTAIFEALAFNCKTILIDLPGIEYMEYLITNEYVKPAGNIEDIRTYIEQDDFKQLNRNYFFQKDIADFTEINP